MILETGEKVHIIERRYFADDIRRHFAGEVIKCTETVVRLRGYVWVYDTIRSQFTRKPEPRERVISLAERVIINIIPREVDLGKIKYVDLGNKGRVVTDGDKFSLDISEFMR